MNKKLIKILNFIFPFLLIIFLTFFSYIVCFKEFQFTFDDSWCFQNTYKLFLGLNLYKDINIITTPLFYYIGALIFKIFTPSIIVFRIYCLLICFALYFLIFKVFRKNNVSFYHSLLYTSIVFIFTYDNLVLGYTTYNTFSLVFVLLGVLLFICKKHSKYYDFLQGFIVFCAFFTKQNIGAFFGIGVLLFELIYCKSGFIKSNCKKFIAFFVPFIFYIVFLMKNNLLNYFVDYAFFSVPGFFTNFYINPYILLFLIFVLTLLLKIYICKNYSDTDFSNINFMLIVAFCLLFAAAPIFNLFHIKIAVILSFVLFFLLIDRYCIADILSNNLDWLVKLLVLFLSIMSIIDSLFSSTYFCDSSEVYYLDDSDVYKFVPLSRDNYISLIELNNYIESEALNGNKVVILSYDSCLVNIYRKEFHGNKDLIFYGNVGSKGVDNIINEISSSSNVLYLVKKSDKDYFWQEIVEIFEYVKSSLTKQGEVLDYEIYSK